MRRRLNAVLESRGSLMMLSLSIDPTFWPGYYVADVSKPTGQRWVATGSEIDGQWVPSQRQALEWCRKRRAVGEFVKALHKAGYLRSPHYFAVIEIQPETLMVHWHILVEASFVPCDKAEVLWGAESSALGWAEA